jgi:hypothetical protein
MKKSLKLACAAAAILLAGAGAAEAKQAARSAPRASATGIARLGGHPNLNGIWQVLNNANWNLEPHEAAQAPAAPEKLGAIGAIPPGLGVVEGGQIPYKPEALKQRDAYRASTPMKDPEAGCYITGIPRATYLNHPFQIIQGDNGDLMMAYEYDAMNRVIHMKAPEEPPINTYMGTSFGQWDGDTLTVTTLGGGQAGVTWLDRSGNYISPNAKVVEHFRLVDKDHIAYDATIEDPTVFTRPWKISMPLYRRMEPKLEILDFRCVPFADLLVYGDLLQSKDGKPAAEGK